MQNLSRRQFIKLALILISFSCFSQSKNVKTKWLDEFDIYTMSSGWDVSKKNSNVEGSAPIRINGKEFKRGVGTHANSYYTINLFENALSFSATIGIDEKSRNIGTNVASIIFKVFTDNELVYQSVILRTNDNAINVKVNLKGKSILKLVVEDAGDGAHGDHANWAMAKIDYLSNGKTPVEFYKAMPEVKPYILTPEEQESPSINSASVYGARPNKPFLYRIPITGIEPITIAVIGLPIGLTYNENTKIIEGKVENMGLYVATITATNSKGSDLKTFEINIGDDILLTPPMGWNSWNAYGLTVNSEKVKKVVEVFESTGLINYGYSYVNIDDGWEAPQRDANGNILSNEKFPDMKSLSNYVHSKGMKFGIYSSPGNSTCGMFLGSYNHEMQDAKTYADWGVDFLKYDWCSYEEITKGNNTLEARKKPYLVMRDALLAQNRDIALSICQYGLGKVETWGKEVGGQLWRTTGDIVDSWGSLNSIILLQIGKEKFNVPSGWNDPDMLILGKVGWGSPLRNTRLTPYEQYTHMTMWCMLSAPLLLGCDIFSMDKITLSLLKNKEVIAVNQDRLGNQASVVFQNDELRVWKKQLFGNKYAIAIVNHGFGLQKASILLEELGIKNAKKVRDVWRQKDMNDIKSIYFELNEHQSEMYVVEL